MASLSLNTLPLAGKIGLGALLCGLVGISYYVMFHSELATKIENEQKRTVTLEDELAKTKELQANYFRDRDELAMRLAKQGEWNKILPLEAEVSTFLSAIQTVSNASGIDLKAWAPMDEVPQSFFAKIPMRLQVTGRFLQIAKFVYEIGKQDRIINIENLELTDPTMQGDDVVLKTSCLATTFHLLKPAASAQPGAASTAVPK